MYAMILDEERNFKWCQMPDPVRKAGEVVIDVHAAAVNRADLMQKDGCYASPEGWPQWCGLEVAGTIAEAGEDSEFKVGDRVAALVGGGGYSEKIAVPEGMVIHIPDAMDMIQAAGIPEVWSTVYLNLQLEAGGMKEGDVFYMQAGASGVGLAAIQYAKLMGAKVITTIDSPEKAAFVKKLGADFVLDYRTEDVRPVIEANPPTVALDCIGGKLMGDCFKNMVFGGRWIMIATMAGAETVINLETVWRKRIRLIGSTLRSRTSEEKSRIMHDLKDKLLPLFVEGKLISNVHAVFPIQEVEAAHGVLRRAENIGKVVLTFK
ncbi:MAG: NAD(P)H-quinone oxidoreductase [Lentisphaeria bacterium]|nr:NAD(P)H-quinone oxidoreductase [Lentisphaeria bacterium]